MVILHIVHNDGGAVILHLEVKTVKIKSEIHGIKKYNRIRLLRQLLPYRIEADYDNG